MGILKPILISDGQTPAGLLICAPREPRVGSHIYRDVAIRKEMVGFEVARGKPVFIINRKGSQNLLPFLRATSRGLSVVLVWEYFS